MRIEYNFETAPENAVILTENLGFIFARSLKYIYDSSFTGQPFCYNNGNYIFSDEFFHLKSVDDNGNEFDVKIDRRVLGIFVMCNYGKN